MPKKCTKCQEEFPYSIKIDGKTRNLGSRKYCLNCSPFKEHNTKRIHLDDTQKECSSCKKTKDLSEFYKKTRGYPYPYCKECMNKMRAEKFKENKMKAISYLGSKCVICSYDKCEAALEFHHLDPNEKDFSISSFKGTDFEKLKPELDKCILVCANCHREVHQGLHVTFTT